MLQMMITLRRLLSHCTILVLLQLCNIGGSSSRFFKRKLGYSQICLLSLTIFPRQPLDKIKLIVYNLINNLINKKQVMKDIQKKLKESKFWSAQYQSFDARSSEAEKFLKDLSLKTEFKFGKEEGIGVTAFEGYFGDDSGYKGNLDNAKVYSGKVPTLLNIVKILSEEEMDLLREQSLAEKAEKEQRRRLG